MRYEIRPLGPWTDLVTTDRHSSGRFSASWQSTLDLLAHETELLGAELVVIQVDVTDGDIRRDGMLYARAKVDFPGVAVSFQSHFGPLRYATDAYDQWVSYHMPGWQANVRAIALALEALRAVDRYGVTRRGEQYTGWKALPAPASDHTFANADAALLWMRSMAPDPSGVLTPRQLHRLLARRMHPDTGGDPNDWHHLDNARRLLDLTEAGHARD